RITVGALIIAAFSVTIAFAQFQRAERATSPVSIVDEHAGHMMMASPQNAAASMPRNQNLPPDADAAKPQLDKSPRHGEWVDIKVANGPALKTFVVYPERSDKAPVVIV